MRVKLSRIPIFILLCELSYCMSLAGQEPLPKANVTSCMAWQSGFEIWMRCSLTGERLIKKVPGLKSWALDPEKQMLVVIRESGEGTLLQTFRIRDGQLRNARKVPSTSILVRTCGTVIQVIDGSKTLTTGVDAFTMKAINLKEPADSFRCSQDQSIVITALRLPSTSVRHTLFRWSQSERVEVATDVLEYDLSPSGNFLAFSQGDRVCVLRTDKADAKECIELVWSQGPLAVDDKGKVLFSAETNEDCGTHHIDPCLAVFQWEVGAANDSMMKFRAWSPAFYEKM
jgi:hypothetical protein